MLELSDIGFKMAATNMFTKIVMMENFSRVLKIVNVKKNRVNSNLFRTKNIQNL